MADISGCVMQEMCLRRARMVVNSLSGLILPMTGYLSGRMGREREEARVDKAA